MDFFSQFVKLAFCVRYRARVLVCVTLSAGVVCMAHSDSVQSSTPAEYSAKQAEQLQQLMEQIKSMQVEIDRLTAASSNDLDNKSAGAQLVATYCTQCHARPQPSLHRAEEWSPVTTRMRAHMEDNLANVKEPTAEEMKTIVAYLQQFSR